MITTRLMQTGFTRPRRQGMALYVSVMMTALIVSLLGMAGIAVVRIERLESRADNEMLVARLNSQSALELAMVTLSNDDAWRTNYQSGLETIPQSLDTDPKGTVSWIIADSDGDLTDSDTSLTLQGIGRVGDAVQVVQVELEIGSLGCLEVALHAENKLEINDSELDNNQVSSSNNLVQENGSSIVNGDVEAVNSINGDDYKGTITTGITPRAMPGSDVFDYYLANGTVIPYASLPSGRIENTVLSSDYNPYGATNPQGIYVIYCGGSKIEIKNSAILGTIILIDPRSDSAIGVNHAYWQPAIANFPALLVSGSIVIDVEAGNGLLDGVDSGGSTTLNDLFGGTMVVGVGNVVDDLPSELNGLFYATGDITIEQRPSLLRGVLISGNNLFIDIDTEVNYSSAFLDNPPPGFLSSEFQVISGSRTRTTAP